jgi:hypothetical protein
MTDAEIMDIARNMGMDYDTIYDDAGEVVAKLFNRRSLLVTADGRTIWSRS